MMRMQCVDAVCDARILRLLVTLAGPDQDGLEPMAETRQVRVTSKSPPPSVVLALVVGQRLHCGTELGNLDRIEQKKRP